MTMEHREGSVNDTIRICEVYVPLKLNITKTGGFSSILLSLSGGGASSPPKKEAMNLSKLVK